MGSKRTISVLSLGLSLSGLAAASLCVGLLTGCTGSFSPGAVEPTQTPIGNIRGSVHGGQNPVTGAQLYLYEAGTTGYGTPATSLICNKNIMSADGYAACSSSSSVYEDSSGNYYAMTDINGDFNLANDYTCTSGDEVYMVAVGGNPGLAAGGYSTGATFTNNSTTITVPSPTWVNVGMTVSGTGVAGTVTAVNGTTVTLNQKTTAGSSENVTFWSSTTSVTTGATFSTNSTTITVSSTTGISTGMLVSGGGVGGTVTKINGTTLTLSQNTTAGSVGTVTFSVPATTATFSKNSNTITVSSAAGIETGMSMSGTGFSGTVTGVSGTTITLNQSTTAAGSGVAATTTVPVNNTAIVQMAALGQCPEGGGTMADQVPYLVINEATTVAFAYSVSGFATSPYYVSSDAGGATALKNAFANATNMVILANGQAPTTFNGIANSSNPQSKINTLANILSTCVNTSSATSSNCASLFKYATTLSGTQATDEASAIFNIAHNQAVQILNGTTGATSQNATNLFNLSTGVTAFSPMVKSVTDWTMPVIYQGAVSALATSNNTYSSGVFGMAFDAEGNAWMGDRALGVVEIGPQGALTTYTNADHGFSMVKGVAVSPQDGTIWVTDFGNNDLYVMDSGGGYKTTITKDVANHGPDSTAFALNPAGSGYLAYEAEESSTGIVAYDATTYAVDAFETNPYGGLTSPGWITVDNVGAVWIPSLGSAELGGLTTTYTTKNSKLAFATSTPGLTEAYVVIADGLGNVWVPTETTPYTLYQVTAGEDQGGQKGGGMDLPWRAAVDGSNQVWLANLDANIVSGFSSSNSSFLSSTGFSTSAAGGTGVAAVGVDPSGNVWAANADGSVTLLVGLGSPTAAPLYGGSTVVTTGKNGKTTVTSGNLGTMP